MYSANEYPVGVGRGGGVGGWLREKGPSRVFKGPGSIFSIPRRLPGIPGVQTMFTLYMN